MDFHSKERPPPSYNPCKQETNQPCASAGRGHIMSEIERFDVLIFGSGTGGKLTAWTSASEGLRTAVVERGLIGGSCPNIACLPTKSVVHSAKVADFVRHDRDFGSGTAPV